MACRLPCIATDIGGPRDIIVDGITGLLIRPADSNAIAEKVNYILDHRDEAIMMGLAGMDRCHSKFADDVCQEAMMECIREYMV
jgi:glycosyltransferase involved in cell wall biosynthesis